MEFDEHFDRAAHSVWRLETLQRYTVEEEAERIAAWRLGLPRPERSIRTSPWLRRIALRTVEGVAWGRAHVVDEPLSEYLRYELQGYVESAVVGEEIHIAPRGKSADLSQVSPDFWLFDRDMPTACALIMEYDSDGRWLGFSAT